MRGNTGILLIAIGLIALYIVLSDKYSCFVQFFDCLTGNEYTTDEGFTRSDYPAGATPSISGSGQTSVWDLWKNLPRVPTLPIPGR